MKIKYTTTENFHVGDKVWLSGFSSHSSGRARYNRPPVLVTICEVKPDGIRVDFDSFSNYYLPSYYRLEQKCNNRYDNMEYNIALTKRESIENYNRSVQEEIEDHFNMFKRIEKLLMKNLL